MNQNSSRFSIKNSRNKRKKKGQSKFTLNRNTAPERGRNNNSRFNKFLQNEKKRASGQQPRNNKNIIQYDEAFVYQMSCKVRGQIPQRTLDILLTNCRIRKRMNEKDIKEYKTEMKSYDEEKIKKTIKGLCNKIGDMTEQKISQKLKQILLITQNSLLKYTLITIFETAISLLTVLNTKQKNKYLQLKCYAKVCKAITPDQALILEIVNKLLNDLKEFICDGKTRKSLEIYVKKKNSFINLYVLVATLWNMQIIPKTNITNGIKYLIDQIQKSDKEMNLIYIQALNVFLQNLNSQPKHFVDLKTIKYIIKKSDYAMKSKFELLDIKDKIICNK